MSTLSTEGHFPDTDLNVLLFQFLLIPTGQKHTLFVWQRSQEIVAFYIPSWLSMAHVAFSPALCALTPSPAAALFQLCNFPAIRGVLIFPEEGLNSHTCMPFPLFPNWFWKAAIFAEPASLCCDLPSPPHFSPYTPCSPAGSAPLALCFHST